MSGFIEGTIRARRLWAPGLLTLTLDAPVKPFVPGQFINLGLEFNGELLRRSYSVASPPGVPLEFFLAEVPGGALTPSLFRLGVGERVLVDPTPQGFFTLDWVPQARNLWMVATGTGLGPYLSMLQTELPWQRFERIVLVHGVRSASELAYASDLLAWSAQHDGRLHHVPVVSRDSVAEHVVHGRVTHALQHGNLEERAGLRLTPGDSHVLLCGNPNMIDEMLALLQERGLRKHRVRKPGHVSTERYWEPPEAAAAQTPTRP